MSFSKYGIVSCLHLGAEKICILSSDNKILSPNIQARYFSDPEKQYKEIGPFHPEFSNAATSYRKIRRNWKNKAYTA